MWVNIFIVTLEQRRYSGSILFYFFLLFIVCVFNRRRLVTVASLSPPLVVEMSLNEVMLQNLNGCFTNLIYEVVKLT